MTSAFNDGLHQHAHAEAGHLLQHLSEVTLGGEQVVDVGADALDRDTRVDTGVGSFLCLQGFERNLRPSSIYTGDWTPPNGASRAATLLVTTGSRGLSSTARAPRHP